ncbi:MAG: hypothetical protein MZV63_19375 [Marinilabiliales bacterium]|nr:hypothetical protein [Marinilabiliales bacterium]
MLGMAAIGLPGTNGFVAELLILIGVLQASPGLAVVAVLGVILGAAYFLGFFQRAFLGPVTDTAVASASDLRPRELLIAGRDGVCWYWPAASFPNWIQGVTASAANAWVERVTADRATAGMDAGWHDGGSMPEAPENLQEPNFGQISALTLIINWLSQKRAGRSVRVGSTFKALVRQTPREAK